MFVTLLTSYTFVATFYELVFGINEEILSIPDSPYMSFYRSGCFSSKAEVKGKAMVSEVVARTHMFGLKNTCTVRFKFQGEQFPEYYTANSKEEVS